MIISFPGKKSLKATLCEDCDTINNKTPISVAGPDQTITLPTDAAVDHVFQYQNIRKEKFKQPIYQMTLHVFNHGTYHRGQLINMLRQLGIEKLPQTDFIVWSRKK